MAGRGAAGHRDPAPPPAPVPTGTGTGWPTSAPTPGTGIPRRRGPGGMQLLPGRPVPPMIDVVTFTARCPGCGADCTWIEEREDTRLRTRIMCDCDA